MTELYRAVALRWSYERGDDHWYGRWRTSEDRARAVAQRWADDDGVDETWVERLTDVGAVRLEPDEAAR